jgi:hypothetical protein
MFFYQVKLGCAIPTLVKTELHAKRMLKEATTVFVLVVIQEPSARVTTIFYVTFTYIENSSGHYCR